MPDRRHRGSALGGGVGLASRAWGTTSDNVVSLGILDGPPTAAGLHVRPHAKPRALLGVSRRQGTRHRHAPRLPDWHPAPPVSHFFAPLAVGTGGGRMHGKAALRCPASRTRLTTICLARHWRHGAAVTVLGSCWGLQRGSLRKRTRRSRGWTARGSTSAPPPTSTRSFAGPGGSGKSLDEAPRLRPHELPRQVRLPRWDRSAAPALRRRWRRSSARRLRGSARRRDLDSYAARSPVPRSCTATRSARCILLANGLPVRHADPPRDAASAAIRAPASRPVSDAALRLLRLTGTSASGGQAGGRPGLVLPLP